MSTPGDSSSSSDQIILRSAKDWNHWISLIRTRASQNDLWDHINPNQETVLSLSEPEIPDPDNYNFVDKPVEDKVRYEHALLLYKRANKAWEKKTRALQDLETHIIKTVGPHFALIQQTRGTHAILRKLQSVLEVPLPQRKDELLQKYEDLKTGPKAQKVQQWLLEWELALGTAQELGMTDLLTHHQPTRAFLKAVSTLDPYFSHRYRQDLNAALMKEATFPDGVEIAQIFRRTFMEEKTPFSAFSGATFQGKKAPDQKEPKKCLDGTLHHTPDTCFILHPSQRPEDWKPGLDHAKGILEKLGSNAALRKEHAEVYLEIAGWMARKTQAQSPSHGGDSRDQTDPGKIKGVA